MLVNFLRRLSVPLCVATCAALFPAGAAAQGAEESFQAAVEAFRTGDTAGATEHLKAVLAENPGHDAAFRMWEAVEQQVITDMLLSRGELGTLAERFLGLARLGREEIASDPGVAEEIVGRLLAGDELERQQAMLDLRAKCGGWAVPALVGPLGDRGNPDNRVTAIQALTHLGSDAVLPLVAVLKSEDEMTRRNAAAVLGSLKDPRAAAGLAWMARDDADQVARQVAGEALAKIGVKDASDAVTVSRVLAESFFRGDPDVTRPFVSSSVIWEWKDGALHGRPVLGGLFALEVAEGIARDALAHDAGDSARPLLAAIHAGEKAEIVAAGSMAALEGNELLAAAQGRLPSLDVDIALAGSHRGRGLVTCLSGKRRQVAAAVTLMDAMGSSNEERQALNAALVDGDPSVSLAAATALARQRIVDPAIVARLAASLTGVPVRTVVSIGATGLSGSAAGWQLVASDTVAEGLLRAKALPPKDVIVVQDGLAGVTLDTVVFGLKEDPRTASVPIIIVTSDVDATTQLYGDKVAKVVSSASFADVASVAGERDGMQQAAIDRARAAADALALLPLAALRSASAEMAAAARSAGDDGLRAAVLGVCAHAGIVDVLPTVEELILDKDTPATVRAAALNAAARLWGLNGGANGNADALGEALLALVDGGDASQSLPAAEALGQLRGFKDSAMSGALQ